MGFSAYLAFLITALKDDFIKRSFLISSRVHLTRSPLHFTVHDQIVLASNFFKVTSVKTSLRRYLGTKDSLAGWKKNKGSLVLSLTIVINKHKRYYVSPTSTPPHLSIKKYVITQTYLVFHNLYIIGNFPKG